MKKKKMRLKYYWVVKRLNTYVNCVTCGNELLITFLKILFEVYEGWG